MATFSLYVQAHYITLKFVRREIHPTVSELYERDALFRNYSHSLDETVDNYNWLKTNTREEEFNLILDEIKDIDHQLEKAERTLNWNSSGNNRKNDIGVFDNTIMQSLLYINIVSFEHFTQVFGITLKGYDSLSKI